jgi:phage shock protein PspC (stress-responsive transcriptional regulator)
MGTRYGRRAADGTTEYYDSKSKLSEAQDAEDLAQLRFYFTFAGLVLGGIATYWAISHFNGTPRLIRFLSVLLGAAAGAYLLRRLAFAISLLFFGAIFLFALYLVGLAIWHFV